MKIAVGVPALAGQDKNQLEVVGDGIDAVGLTTLLRKNVGYSELVSVGPVPQKKNEATPPVPVEGYYPYPYPYGAGHVYEIRDQNPYNCSIILLRRIECFKGCNASSVEALAEHRGLKMRTTPDGCAGVGGLRIVIKVAIKGQKSRSKAMRIVGGVAGVESVAFAAHDSNHMVVTGEGIDAVKLTKLLRRKVGSSEIVSVGPGEHGGDGYGYGYGYGTMQVPVGGYYSYPSAYGYGSGQGYGYETRNQNPYSYGPGYGYETSNQSPNSCSIL
ncbi:hypothetical protein RHGRI_018121 [Rhododendron griersonianum]|uniref:HMA domain-containing protein n=1 Tax=Rhododendron griersonianum TaxID=479676 RepID=A0AAV6K0B3_9ERIC|nr:hypothetical protein RHGRI_018121 [Rhododendron griersonianum]